LGWSNTYSTQATNLYNYLSGLTAVAGAGHSNGGIVLRQHVQQYGANTRVNRAMTIGSPHLGAQLAKSYADGEAEAWATWIIGRILSAVDFFYTFDYEFEVGPVEANYIYNLTSLLDQIPEYISGLGFDPNAPVSPQMFPGSSFLTSLNGSSGQSTEAAYLSARVGVGTSVDPDHSFWRTFTNDVGPWETLRAALYTVAVDRYYYYAYEHPDPWLSQNAWRWDHMAAALYWMQADWSWLVGAWNGYVIAPHDAVVPLASQQWPGCDCTTNFAYPQYDISHNEQIVSAPVMNYIKSTFQNTFGIVYPSISVNITGPTMVVTPGSRTWSSTVSGGSSYSYAWAYRPNGSTTWYPQGQSTGPTHTTPVAAIDNPGFDLRLTVTSGGITGSDVHHVSVQIESGGGCGGGPCE
jgi:hypothetical protein